MVTKFWSTLFDDGEWVNIVEDVKGTHVIPISWLKEDRYNRASNPDNFFCINPLTQFGRKDTNVTCLRNILIEFDKLPLKDQVEFSHSIPFTTLTFSGGKSYHYIISLKEPCETIEEYRKIVNRIRHKLPDMDKSTGNPSRLSRTPGALRDKMIEQKLLVVNSRISRFDLELWLGPEKLKTEESERVIMPIYSSGKRLLPVRVLTFMKYGANEGGRNRALFINACELFRANYSKEEIFDIAMRVLDLPVTEIRQCIASAERAVANELA